MSGLLQLSHTSNSSSISLVSVFGMTNCQYNQYRSCILDYHSLTLNVQVLRFLHAHHLQNLGRCLIYIESSCNSILENIRYFVRFSPRDFIFSRATLLMNAKAILDNKLLMKTDDLGIVGYTRRTLKVCIYSTDCS